MNTINPHTELYAALRRGATVVTVNRRLLRTLADSYDADCLQQGLGAWVSPALSTRDAFVRELADRLAQPPQLLTAAQSLLLWEEVIRADIAATENELLQVPATARSARAASVLLDRYSVSFGDADAACDQQAFLRWRAAWKQRVRKQGWAEVETLAPLVAAAIKAGQLELPDEVVFAGFDEFLPDDVLMRAALQQRGCRVIDWQPPPHPAPQRLRVGCTDPEGEVLFAARTVRDRLQATPQARIGIVVTQLSAYLPLLQSRFVAELDPVAWTSGLLRSPLVNFSLGVTLDRTPAVYAALRLLRLGDQVALDDVAWLLRTPWLSGAAAERSARALAEVNLRARKLAQWPLSALVRLLSDKQVPAFAKLLASRQQQLRSRRKQLPGAWGEQLARELHACGWPGDRPLGSEDFQVVRHFRDQLAALAGFDPVSPPVDRAGALALLSGLCADTLFQPEGDEAPVQVLGLLEAAGQRFDTLIVLGLHDAAFPAPCNPNPFIPLPLQRQLRMPHADAGRELDFAQHTAAQLFSAAGEVLLCWPQQIDGTPRQPSPLLDAIPGSDRQQHEAGDAAARFLAQAQPLETIEDRQAPPIHAQSPVSGGTGLIKDQALCPFRAFAHHRLRARGFEEVDLGFDGMERGTLTHSVLELFWAETKDQRSLLALDQQDCMARLAACVEQALARFEKSRRCDLPPLSRTIEAQRLQRLAAAWLQLDREREPFAVQVELSGTEQVGPLQIRTRIDRIDRLEDGRQAIIDYKTGQVDARGWFEPRLTEPQLPIYCQDLSAEQVAAVLFACVPAGSRKVRFNGVAAEPDCWPGLNDSSQQRWFDDAGIDGFGALLDRWKQTLAVLGEAFVAGDATVAPLETACRSCDLQPLCRIHEAGTVAEGEGV